MNSEVRAKKNVRSLSNPFDFDLELARLALRDALRREHEKSSRAGSKFTGIDRTFGLTKEETATAQKENKDPTKYCAVCHASVALRLCSGCRSMAFCCRDHQVQYWPTHKADCKRIQKDKKQKK